MASPQSLEENHRQRRYIPIAVALVIVSLRRLQNDRCGNVHAVRLRESSTNPPWVIASFLIASRSRASHACRICSIFSPRPWDPEPFGGNPDAVGIGSGLALQNCWSCELAIQPAGSDVRRSPAEPAPAEWRPQQNRKRLGCGGRGETTCITRVHTASPAVHNELPIRAGETCSEPRSDDKS